MTYRVRFTHAATADLNRLYDFIIERDDTDLPLAERALQAIRDGIATLRTSPFTCRKAEQNTPFLRELLIPFGHTGYVALFEIESNQTVTVLAVRHQLEDDYH
ncbi:type II toxin-antitoxin system RelE/ParE family toxin [Paraburkholderia sp. MMS20-SJTR3]|uniref:Type II toxin-antitoxin system RelE/ParE family toxin n=1 Tax=Paraburkholderia sejongensis TaxID=2886946 RepID=A0ABS8JV75_9BURK|nr:type II toxin-antitoxin system RelE/ParE family toxin [Paraburkholderia sp. MMS20-SJTR3]MCC8393811.1 type II toxin-antitoxin system RelE/ParE family toxin [Paraburkholderia sp. MMS20-SJTR3]